MPRRPSRRGLKELPRQEMVWHLAIHQLRTWVETDDGDAVRPSALLLLNLSNGLIQHSSLTPGYPKAGDVAEFLAEAMRRRDATLGIKPGRPTLIQIEDEALLNALARQLANIGVRLAHVERSEAITSIFTDLEKSLRSEAELKGLLAVRGVKPEVVAGFYAAAAGFFRAAVWERFSDEEVLLVEVVESKRERFVVVMGGGGVEYGLAVYEKWADIERMFLPSSDPFGDPLDHVPAKGAHALYFNDITETPFDDIEDIERYGWEIADEYAYPVPIIVARSGSVRRPQRPELQWYEAVLRALPLFVRDHWRRDEQREALPVEAVIPVTTSAGEAHVRIAYPAGVLPARDERLINPLAWLDEAEEEGIEAPDRRLMERVFRDVLGPVQDDDVDQAQQIMYEAWEERTPAQRIALARQALEVSPDCADAYVLLAEEEAKTPKEALALYEEGVKAGERALGQDYFRENAGYFWGLVETRPYMRARQRLGEVLWDLGRRQEAADHFRELLRLNPNDNQGVRYQLLNVLMEMENDADARNLIKQYRDDDMAAWTFTNALLAFRQHGSGRAANTALKKALSGNPHVAAYLSGKKRLPAHLPEYMGFGDQNEAIHYAAGFRNHWRQTPGAIEWLKAATK